MIIMELGAIGEMIGCVAVIGSLLFVWIQIRTSVKTMRATSTYEAEHTWAVVNEQLALNPELGEAVDSWIYGSGELDARGAMLVKYWGRGVLQRTEAQYFLFKAGLMDRELWENRRDALRALINDGPTHLREWWEAELPQNAYTAEFIAQIDSGRRG